MLQQANKPLVVMPTYNEAGNLRAIVAAVYGALAYLTNSIFPSIVLHAGGNVVAAFGLFTQGRSAWQASSTPQPLIWDSGADASFWGSLVAALMVAAAAVWAYAGLARSGRPGR